MDIQKLTAKYDIRKLNEADIEDIFEVIQRNTLFFQHCPPMATRQSISADMNALPPRTAYEDKYYIGYDKIFNYTPVSFGHLRIPQKYDKLQELGKYKSSKFYIYKAKKLISNILAYIENRLSLY